MTYFETPNDTTAARLGMTTTAYEDHIDAVTRFREEFGDADRPVEERRYVDEYSVQTVTDTDRTDYERMLDHETFEGFGR